MTSFRGRPLPEPGIPVGYAGLISRYDLQLPLPPRLAAVAERHHPESTGDWLLVTPRHRPEETLAGQLEFALKWEGVDLSVFHALTKVVPAGEFEALVLATPTGSYTRRIWFLYEWLTGKTLALPNAPKVRAVPALNSAQQFALLRGTVSTRHRVINNIPGTRAFSPLVRRTTALNTIAAKQLDLRAREVLGRTHGDVIGRAAAFLLLSDSRSSFSIEGERPSRQRAARWAQAIGQAGARPLSLDELERLQQIVIGDARLVHLGLRVDGGFVGDHDRLSHEPLPEHISARADDLRDLLTGVVDYVSRAIAGELDPIVAAATAAFGFIYIHPFEDGNGRLHRWLIHHALAIAGYNPPGVVFPVSAAILRELDNYKRVLESYSKPLLPYIDWDPTVTGNLTVLNETSQYYRYFDATAHTEFLYQCVATTVERDLPDEVAYLEGYDRFAARVQHVVDLPARTVELLHRFLQQGHGCLSQRASDKEFAALSAEEIRAIEHLYIECFPRESVLTDPITQSHTTADQAIPPLTPHSFTSRPIALQREQVIATARKLATPIDIRTLIAAGIIAKARGAWYEVLDSTRLPDHAAAQIREVRWEGRGPGTQRQFVKIPPLSKRAVRLYRELTGEDAPPAPLER
ncbi:MAG: Fic family protein [Gemmatimonadaceae bacterium]